MSTLNHIWGHIEATFSIIAACLPTIVPVFTKIRSAESLVGSVRKLYLKSKSSFSLPKRSSSTSGSRTDVTHQSNPAKMSDEGSNEWSKINVNKATVITK